MRFQRLRMSGCHGDAWCAMRRRVDASARHGVNSSPLQSTPLFHCRSVSLRSVSLRERGGRGVFCSPPLAPVRRSRWRHAVIIPARPTRACARVISVFISGHPLLSLIPRRCRCCCCCCNGVVSAKKKLWSTADFHYHIFTFAVASIELSTESRLFKSANMDIINDCVFCALKFHYLVNWFKNERRNLWANLLVVAICFWNSELTLFS